jgi:hypothetical protein
MRQKLIVGNWKMFTTAATAGQLAAARLRETMSSEEVAAVNAALAH